MKITSPLILTAVIISTIVFVIGAGIVIFSISQLIHKEAWENGCRIAKLKGCKTELFVKNSRTEIKIENYDINFDNKDEGIGTACEHVFKTTDPEKCRKLCCKNNK